MTETYKEYQERMNKRCQDIRQTTSVSEMLKKPINVGEDAKKGVVIFDDSITKASSLSPSALYGFSKRAAQIINAERYEREPTVEQEVRTLEQALAIVKSAGYWTFSQMEVDTLVNGSILDKIKHMSVDDRKRLYDDLNKWESEKSDPATEVLDMFRQWNHAWDEYGKGIIKDKPHSLDEFMAAVNERFEIKRK